MRHGWPGTRTAGPTPMPMPMPAVCSGLWLNFGLYTVARDKMWVDGATQTNLAGWLMTGFDLRPFSVAAWFLHRQSDIQRLFGAVGADQVSGAVMTRELPAPYAAWTRTRRAARLSLPFVAQPISEFP